MSTTRQIAHNTIVQIVGKIISTLLGLVALGMITRHLGQTQFGWYITTIAFLQFVGILIDFGLTPVTAQMMSEPRFDKKQLFQNLLGFRFVTAIVFFMLAPFAAFFFPYAREIKIAIGISTLAFAAIAMNQVLIGLYQTKLKMHIVSLGEVIGRVFLVGGIWLIVQRGFGFLPIMAAVTLSSLIYTAILWCLGKKETAVGLAFDKEIWWAISKKMWPIAVSIIFNVVYLKGDIILLSLFVSQAEVGIYGAAYRVLDVLTQSAMMLMGVLLPLLAFAWSRKNKEEFKKLYQQSFDAMMLFSVPMMIGTIVLAEPIMRFIAGDNFAASGQILALLAVAVFGVYLGAVFGHTAVAINKQKQTMWIYISNAIITLIGYLIFIPRFGILGAAYMTVFSELYAGLLLFFTIRHFTKEKLRFKTLAKIIFSALTMAATIYLAPEWHVLWLVLLGAAVYSIMILSTRAVSKQTLKEVLTIKQA